MYLNRLLASIALLIILTSSGMRVFAADTLYRAPVWVSVRYSYGFILAHHNSMEAFTRNHVSLFEGSVAYNSEFSNQKASSFNTGLSYLYSSLSNTRILGDVHAVVPWVEWPWRLHDFSLSLRMGLGLSWVTNPFDLETNFRNTAIGSNLNAAILIDGGASYKAVPGWVWSLGLRFVHFSNGSTKQPNYGINLPMLYAGVAYNLVHAEGASPKHADLECFHTFYAGFLWVGGKKQIFPVNGPDYFSMLSSTYAGYRFSPHLAGLVGFDVSYNEADVAFLNRDSIVVVQRTDVIKTGLSLGVSKHVGRLGLSFRFGYYVHQLETSDGPFYDILSLSCPIYHRLEGRVLLKTHFARADFIGLGLSYSIDF